MSPAKGSDSPTALRPVTKTGRGLGTQISLTAYHTDSALAERAIAAAFAELERVEQCMSLYRPDSQLSKLNRSGRLDSPHPWLVAVLRTAVELSEQTAGAFDVSVQPLWLLYSQCRQAGRTPSANEIANARQRIDWQQIEIASRRIRLRKPGMALTLNGIAQGFAADRVRDALEEHGVRHALMNTGEISTLGSKPDGETWTIGIQHPRQPDAYISLAKLGGRCLATSGDYATTFRDDHTSHHLFDPRTGRSPTELSSVSIVAETGLQADALSTAVFVLGEQRGLELVRSLANVEAYLVRKDGSVVRTAAFPVAG